VVALTKYRNGKIQSSCFYTHDIITPLALLQHDKFCTPAEFLERHSQAITAALSKVNGGKKGNKDVESKFKGMLTNITEKYEQVAQIEQVSNAR